MHWQTEYNRALVRDRILVTAAEMGLRIEAKRGLEAAIVDLSFEEFLALLKSDDNLRVLIVELRLQGKI